MVQSSFFLPGFHTKHLTATRVPHQLHCTTHQLPSDPIWCYLPGISESNVTPPGITKYRSRIKNISFASPSKPKHVCGRNCISANLLTSPRGWRALGSTANMAISMETDTVTHQRWIICQRDFPDTFRIHFPLVNSGYSLNIHWHTGTIINTRDPHCVSTIHPPFLVYSIVHECIKLSKLASNACFVIWEAAAVTDLLNLSWQWLEVATLITIWSLGRDSPSSLLSLLPTHLTLSFMCVHSCTCVFMCHCSCSCTQNV